MAHIRMIESFETYARAQARDGNGTPMHEYVTARIWMIESCVTKRYTHTYVHTHICMEMHMYLVDISVNKKRCGTRA